MGTKGIEALGSSPAMQGICNYLLAIAFLFVMAEADDRLVVGILQYLWSELGLECCRQYPKYEDPQCGGILAQVLTVLGQ